MTERTIILGDELIEFTSEQHWINSAQRTFEKLGIDRNQNGVANYICLDAIGRVCQKGKEFMRATREETYPIKVYLLLA